MNRRMLAAPRRLGGALALCLAGAAQGDFTDENAYYSAEGQFARPDTQSRLMRGKNSFYPVTSGGIFAPVSLEPTPGNALVRDDGTVHVTWSDAHLGVDWNVPPEYLHVGDLDGDGLDDLVLREAGATRLLRNTGNGFELLQTLRKGDFGLDWERQANTLTLVDVDDNGRVDLHLQPDHADYGHVLYTDSSGRADVSVLAHMDGDQLSAQGGPAGERHGDDSNQAAASEPEPGRLVGKTAGELEVDSQGAANYMLRLTLPPGAAGMTPPVTLHYASNAGDGPMGLGWRIGPRSVITRCVEPGVRRTVNFDERDRFCLDGQLLVAVEGEYGSDGTAYRTEIDSGVLVRSHGRFGTGPRYFRVISADGRVRRYGHADDARLQSNRDHEKIKLWALDRETNTSGAGWTLHYATDNANGEQLVREIRYGGNAVTFRYAARPDVRTGWAYGTRQNRTRRLVRVTVTRNGHVYRSYRIGYERGKFTGRGRVAWVQECAGSGLCLPETRFNWQEPDAGPGRYFGKLSPLLKLKHSGAAIRKHSLDYNGDGISDYIRWIEGFNSVSLHLSSLDEQGKLVYSSRRIPVSRPGSSLFLSANSVLFRGVIDHDNDGRDAISGIVNTNCRSKSSCNRIVGAYVYDFTIKPGKGLVWGERLAPRFGLLADFNGDSWPDIFGRKYRFRNENGRFRKVGKSGSPGGGFNPVFNLDLYSNGRVSIVWKGISTLYLDKRRICKRCYSPALADMDGDGSTDLTYSRKKTFRYRLNTGRGLAGQVNTGIKNIVGVVDINADGLSDLIRIRKHGRYVFLNRGNGRFTRQKLGLSRKYVGLRDSLTFKDVNLDGFPDLLIWQGDNLYVRYHRGDRRKPDLLTGITDGFGVSTTIRYSPLSDPRVHTRAKGFSKGSERAIAGAHYVVSEVTSPEETVRYRYAGARIDRAQHGFLGFSHMASVTGRLNEDGKESSLVTINTYHQRYPFIGRVSSTEKAVRQASPDKVVAQLDFTRNADGEKDGPEVQALSSAGDGGFDGPSTRENEWEALELPSGRIHPYVAESRLTEFDLDGRTLRFTVTDNQVIAQGHAPRRVRETVTVYSSPAAESSDGAGYRTITANGGWASSSGLGDYRDTLITRRTVSRSAPGTETRQRTTAYRYDGRGRLVEETAEPGHRLSTVTTYRYDDHGNVVHKAVTGRRGPSRHETSRYGQQGSVLISQSNALGHTVSIKPHSVFALPDQETDPNGRRTTHFYDDLGRRVYTARPDGTSTEIQHRYCAAGLAGCEADDVYFVRERTTGQPTTERYFDARGRETRVRTRNFSDTGWLEVRTEYDRHNRTVRVSEPRDTASGKPVQYTAYRHDVLDRKRSVDAPGGYRTTYIYDGLGVTEINAEGRWRTRRHDVLDRLVESIDHAGVSTEYRYDAFDRRTEIRYPRLDIDGRVRSGSQHVIRRVYDVFGNVVEERDPNSGTWRYAYNIHGEVITQRSARVLTGEITEPTRFRYDRLGRLVRRVEPEGTTCWFHDDDTTGLGQLSRVARFEGTQDCDTPGVSPHYQERYAHDSRGRPWKTRTLIAKGNHVERFEHVTTYDDASRPRDRIYPTGVRVRRHYSASGYLTQVDNGQTGPGQVVYRTVTAMDARGNVTQDVLGQVLRRNHVFDSATGNLRSLYVNSGRTRLLRLDYETDRTGQVTRRHDRVLDRDERFTYDPHLGTRLARVDVTHAGYTQTTEQFTYDALGNIRHQQGVGDYHYDPSRPHAVAGVTGDTISVFTYDANGNMVSGKGRTLAYTSYDLPHTIRRGATRTQFDYGPDQANYRRVETDGNGQVTTTLTLGDYERVTHQGKTQHKHYIGDFAVLTRYEEGGAESLHYLIRDPLGSVLAIVNADNPKKAQRFIYSAFGKQTAVSKAKSSVHARITKQGYTGHQELTALGLIHMKGRIYDPELARFLQPDPVIQEPTNLQNLNRYSYVLNRPLNLSDPSGYEWSISSAWNAFTSWVGSVFNSIGNAISSAFGSGGGRAGSASTSLGAGESPNRVNHDLLNTGAAPAGLYLITIDPESEQQSINPAKKVTEAFVFVNGILNSIRNAVDSGATHIERAAMGKSQRRFNVFYNPTKSFFHDVMESTLDKLGITTAISKRLASLLRDTQRRGHSAHWVVHSQGGIIFSEAARHAGSIPDQKVTFHNGGNNISATRYNLREAGIRDARYLNHPYDPVPNILGLNTINPVKIIGSVVNIIPTVFGGEEHSPHSRPCGTCSYEMF